MKKVLNIVVFLLLSLTSVAQISNLKDSDRGLLSTVYLYDTVCEGDSYGQYGFDIDSIPVGTSYYTLHFAFNDSTVYLYLYAYAKSESLIQAQICEGEDYTENGFNIINPEVGVLNDSLILANSHYCDSIVRLELTVNPVLDTTYYDTICQGNNYSGHGFVVNQPPAGIYYDTIASQTPQGCADMTYLELNVKPWYNIYIYDSICEGEDYEGYGFEIIQPSVGVLTQTHSDTGSNGCDSIVNLVLRVNPNQHTYINDAICYGEDYFENGFVVIHPPLGVMHDTLRRLSYQGCDSTVYLELTVAPLYSESFVDTICSGETYTQHGFNIPTHEQGVIFDTLFLETMYGCDSLLYLQLVVWDRFDTYFADEICYGEDYQEHGFNIIKPQPGLLRDTLFLQTTHGCDSIIYLSLNVYPVYSEFYEAEICDGEDYIGYGFTFIQPPLGYNYDTLYLQTVHGCDSTVHMRLLVNPLFDTYIVDTICQGDNYTLHGFNIINPPVGETTATLNLYTTHSCDSMLYLTLEVIPRLDFGDSEIIGNMYVYAQTDIQTGWYEYRIDSLPYWDEFRWEFVEPNNWTMIPDGRTCNILVKGAGEYTLRITAENYCDTTYREIKITGRFFGVDENESINADVYPNPVNDALIIESEEIIRTTIMGVYGQKVKSQNHDMNNRVVVNVSDLSRGMYMILIETRKGNVYKQIIVE